MSTLHHHVFVSFVVLLFGGNLQDDRVNLLSVSDQTLHEPLAGILGHQND